MKTILIVTAILAVVAYVAFGAIGEYIIEPLEKVNQMISMR